MTTDLIIIGAGPGGYRAAEYAAAQGLQVTIIEEDLVGGTCLNRGCIPTKTYVHAATLEEAIARQQEVVALLRSGVEGILSKPGITLLRGRAALTDANTVRVVSATAGSETITDGSETITDGSETIVTAPHIIIATGSETKWLPIAGRDNPRVVDSTALLAMTTLPRKLCVIGAGVIGMEMASVFHRFGAEVTVIEYLKECLPTLDSDIAKRLRKVMEKRGIVFKMKTAVENLDDIDVDVILMATGRKPRTQGLNLEAAGITLTPQGAIATDDNYRCLCSHPVTAPTPLATTTPLAAPAPLAAPSPSLYAIGDVNGRQMLAHAAEMQAMRVVNHILGKTDGIRFDIMPAAIFTQPEAACVGPTEDQLKSLGTDYVCHKAFWRANGKAQAMNETEGMLKLFAASDSGRILGCHAFGAHAADLVQEVSVLMCRDTTTEQLRDMVHIHPTLSEILTQALK